MSLDITKLDLYAILGVSEDATDKEIVKSYRKQALKCHPDKNPDDPNAAELFHKLSKALEILTDAAARAAYDKAQKANKAAEKRNRELDSKRKKLKEDLEARERTAQSSREAESFVTRNLQAEIERLRKEGSKLLEEEQERLRQEVKQGKDRLTNEQEEEVEEKTPKLKIKWKAKKGDEENGGYSYEVLISLLEKYGEVLNLLVSSKKKGSAIVEFASWIAAKRAFEVESGKSENPLTISWIGGQSAYTNNTTKTASDAASNIFPVFTENKSDSFPQAPMSSGDRDYENLVLTKLRQAEERKRLIEQMQKEDEES